MKKQLNQKLNEEAARLLVKDLDEQALSAVTGGGGIALVGGGAGCRTCGIMATTGT